MSQLVETSDKSVKFTVNEARVIVKLYMNESRYRQIEYTVEERGTLLAMVQAAKTRIAAYEKSTTPTPPESP